MVCEPGQDEALAQRLARSVSAVRDPGAAELELRLTAAGLELHDRRQRRLRGLRVDFLPSAGRYRSFPIARRGPFAQALGRRTRVVVDATAGWGADAARMSWMGLRVVAIERHPVMASLLLDAQQRLAQQTLFADHGLSPPRVVAADARSCLNQQQLRPDCVYLDPMFPPKRRASALPVRPLLLLRELVGDDVDAKALFAAAMRAACQRVVVKRPDHAPPLVTGPDETFAGKLVRYDVYLKKP